MAFEVFKPQHMKAPRPMWITLTARGGLGISNQAFKSLGEPQAVQLMLDREAGIIGIRKTARSDPDAYSIGSSRTVNARAFTNWAGLAGRTARRWDAYLQDGTLCCDINGPAYEVSSNRSGTGHREEDA